MAELRSGISLAGYRIESLLGTGSTGSVFSALDIALDRRVAVKVLFSELARDERFRERFLRESRIAAALEHPNIVPIHAAGEADGHLYLVMRQVDGRDLAATLKRLRRLDPDTTLELAGQIAGALDAAHARGLIHRDVKPANILLSSSGGGPAHAYLCDFGLAKHASSVSSLSGDRSIIGTVDYLAPEQIQGGPVDGRVDVYALGCVIHECLTGEPPYRRDNELAALLAHVNEPPPRVTDSDPELPAALADVVGVMLAHDRDERFDTAGEAVAAARTALAGGAVTTPAPVRRPAPTVRTFLFADIRGYTAFTREHGDEAAADLAGRFAAIARELAAEHGGHVQELRGDEALVVFPSARDALRFAVGLDERITAAELPRRAGVGLDAGEAVPVEEGYRGGALNRAARLCSIAGPGEALASEAVVDLAGPAEGVVYGLRRLERLKGFDRPVRVVEVHPDGAVRHGERRRQVAQKVGGMRPRLRLALLAAALLTAAAAVVLATRGDGGGGGLRLQPDRIGLLDATTLKPVAALDRIGSPDAIVADGKDGVWAFDATGRTATHIDARTRKVTGRIPLGDTELGGIALGAGSLWVGDGAAPAVVRYDPRYGTQTARIELKPDGLTLPDQTTGLTFGGGSLWASYGAWPFRIVRIDPAANRVTKTIDLERADGQALLAFGAGALWAISQDTGRFWKLDPASGAVTGTGKIHDGWVGDAAWIGDSLWLAAQDDRAVWQVDERADITRSVATGDTPYALGRRGADVYVANQNAGSISRIDPATGHVRTVRIGHRANSAAVAGGLVWVALSPSAADARQGLDPATTLRIATRGDPWYSTDPAIANAGEQWQLQRAIGARLLRYPDGPIKAGAPLLPEIADLPVVSDGGRTYTFTIRPGYRFSPPSGATVTAETMRATIERALSPGFRGNPTDPSISLGDVVGAAAYHEGRAAHVSGIHVDGDRLSFTLRRPAPDFPARITLPPFSAVPIGTPVRPHGLDAPIPSAGPYYLASHIGDSQTVLRRNPNYRGPRPHQVKAFLVTNDVGLDRGVDLVTAGKSDMVAAPPPASNGGAPAAWSPGGALERRYGGRSSGPRLIRAPSIAVRFLAFNTARGLFRDPRLRRAVALAVDRTALARAGAQLPWSSAIPPGIAGVPDGPVAAPDLARARALARGHGGKALMLVNTPDRCGDCAAVGAVVRRQLAAIGIDLTVRDSQAAAEGVFDPGQRADLLQMGWIYDWPDPSNVFNGILASGPARGYGYPVRDELFHDATFTNAVNRAFLVAGAGRGDAYRAVERTMAATSPPLTAIANDSQPTLVGARVGCVVAQPQDFGQLDLAALCLK